MSALGVAAGSPPTPRITPPAGDTAGAYAVEVRVEVRPRWVFRLSHFHGRDGLTRMRGGVLHRLLHREGSPVWVRVAQVSRDRVLFGARAGDRDLAEWGIERMRRCTGVDHDLRAFHERFAADPLIGRAVRAQPGLRTAARPDPFEALTWAVCEQLIEYERGAAIERRLIARLGSRCATAELRDSPGADVVAGQSPALLASMDLAPGRGLTLIRAAREVASGRVDLDAADPEAGWRRLRLIRGIGAWTVECLALHGQGRLDQLPAGDLAYIKLVGRLLHGHPYGRATEAEVRECFAPYAPWAGLAGAYALRSAVPQLAAGRNVKRTVSQGARSRASASSSALA